MLQIRPHFLRSLLFLLHVALCSFIYGEETVLPVIGEKWFISVDMPRLDQIQGARKDSGFQFLGVSLTGFNISFFVEEPKSVNGSHQDCYEFYWSKMKRNPMINMDTVKVEKTESYVKVAYEMKGLPAKAPKDHVNYFIVHEGKWIDIHLSMVSELNPSETCATFEKTLRFRTLDDRPSTSKPPKS